jgi:hypothetical protein
VWTGRSSLDIRMTLTQARAPPWPGLGWEVSKGDGQHNARRPPSRWRNRQASASHKHTHTRRKNAQPPTSPPTPHCSPYTAPLHLNIPRLPPPARPPPRRRPQPGGSVQLREPGARRQAPPPAAPRARNRAGAPLGRGAPSSSGRPQGAARGGGGQGRRRGGWVPAWAAPGWRAPCGAPSSLAARLRRACCAAVRLPETATRRATRPGGLCSATLWAHSANPPATAVTESVTAHLAELVAAASIVRDMPALAPPHDMLMGQVRGRGRRRRRLRPGNARGCDVVRTCRHAGMWLSPPTHSSPLHLQQHLLHGYETGRPLPPRTHKHVMTCNAPPPRSACCPWTPRPRQASRTHSPASRSSATRTVRAGPSAAPLFQRRRTLRWSLAARPQPRTPGPPPSSPACLEAAPRALSTQQSSAHSLAPYCWLTDCPAPTPSAGRVFGGFLLRRAFELAFATCYVFAGSRPIFDCVDDVQVRGAAGPGWKGG